MELMKQNGLTEENLKNIEITRQMAKIQLEQADAERKLVQDNNWEIELTPEQRLDCVNKMALGLTMQAEVQRAKNAEKTIEPPPKPEKMEGEPDQAFAQRMTDWALKVTQMVDDKSTDHKHSDIIADLRNGGSQLQKLSEKMISPEQREQLAKNGPEAAYQELKQDTNRVNAWEKKVKSIYENSGRERMEEKQRQDFAEKIDKMRKDPANASFVEAVDDVLKTGSDGAKRLLYGMEEKKLTELQSMMANKNGKKLGALLEATANAAPHTAENDAQTKAVENTKTTGSKTNDLGGKK